MRHYGGSTLDPMPPAMRRLAHMLNDLERIRSVRGRLTPYQRTVRLWATARIRSWNYYHEEVHDNAVQ